MVTEEPEQEQPAEQPAAPAEEEDWPLSPMERYRRAHEERTRKAAGLKYRLTEQREENKRWYAAQRRRETEETYEEMPNGEKLYLDVAPQIPDPQDFDAGSRAVLFSGWDGFDETFEPDQPGGGEWPE